jgi:hypothetical protein
LFATSEKVLLHDEKIFRGRSAKLSQPYIGPYEIISVDDVNIAFKAIFGCIAGMDCSRSFGYH